MNRLRGIVIASSIGLLSWIGCGKDSQTEIADDAGVPATPPVIDQATIEPVLISPESSLPNSELDATDPELDVTDSASNPTKDSDSESTSDQQIAADQPVAPAETEVSPDVAMSSAGADANAQPPSESQPSVDPPELRVLLPTTAGLILLDVDVRIGEARLEDAFDQQIDQIFQELGGQSTATWEDFLEKIRSDTARFGRSMFESQQTSNVTRLFDTNRNGRPDPEETAKILFRRSQTDQPFRVDGTDSFRSINRSLSPTLMALDRNQDREVDAEEIQFSRDSMMRLDQNGDGRIERREVLPAAPQNDPAWNRRRSTRWGDVAMDLTGYVNWQMLTYSIEQAGQTGAFNTEPGLLERLDADGDGSISAEEAERLRQIEPDVRLQIRFAIIGSRTPEIDIAGVAQPLRSQVTINRGNGQVSLTSDSLTLMLRAADLLGRADLIPDEAFSVLDADQDGGLDEEEIPAGALREYSFDQLDLDDDGKLILAEIREAMAQQPSIWSVQVRARAAESRDAMFDWLDRNRDQMLSARELKDLPQQLSDRVADDGVFTAIAIPDSFEVIFGRGDPDRNEQLFASSTGPTPTRESRPRWAQAMDSNGDGDIDDSEFLGTPEQFQTLDQNGDGFVDSIESGGSMGNPDPDTPRER